MAFYLDTSAFLKSVMVEPETNAFISWVRETNPEFMASYLLRTEALRTAGLHSPEAVDAVRERLGAVTLVVLSPTICREAAELVPAGLRSLDALHLATALAFIDDLQGLLTYDRRLAEAAQEHGIAVVTPK